jgi:hypothetical protein
MVNFTLVEGSTSAEGADDCFCNSIKLRLWEAVRGIKGGRDEEDGRRRGGAQRSND